MTSSHRPAPANDDDPWQDLAEELFGVECGKEHTVDQSSRPVDEPSADPIDIPREPTRTEPVLLSESDLMFDEDEGPAEDVEVLAEIDAADDGDTADSELAEDEVEPTPAAKESDTFWDALADWNWDESSERSVSSGSSDSGRRTERPSRGGGHGRRDERSGHRERSSGQGESGRRSERGGDRSRREHSAPSHAQRTPVEPKSSDDGFGEGLLGDEPRSAPVRSSHDPLRERDIDSRDSYDSAERDESVEDDSLETTEPDVQQTSETDETGAPRKRRRRRRRGRRDSDAPPPSGHLQPAAESTADDEDAAEDFDEPSAVREQPELIDDDFGADLSETDETPREDSESKPTDRPRRRRSRRGRGRGRGRDAGPGEEAVVSRSGAEEEADFPRDMDLAEPAAELDDVGEADEEDGPVDHTATYANVPTWEEAISYLLRPSTVQADPGGKRSPPPAGDQKKPTRHYGHRRS